MALKLSYNRNNPPLTSNLVQSWGTTPTSDLYGYDVQKPLMRPPSLQKSYTIVGDHRLSALMQMSSNQNLASFQKIASYRPASFATTLQAGPLKFASKSACLASYPQGDLNLAMACDRAF